LSGDEAAYEHEIERAKGTFDYPLMLLFKGGGQATLGKMKAARQTLEQGRTLLMAGGIKDFAGTLDLVEGFTDELFGYESEGREKAQQALALSQDPEVQAQAAQVLAMSGDVAKADALMSELSRRFPDNQRLRQVSGPRVRALIALRKNRPQDAVAALEALRPYELGTGPNGVGFDPIYLRGLAYLKLADGNKAAAEFQRILDHRGAGVWDPEYSLAHLRLAQAYVLQKDIVKVRAAYQDFFAAWKDADADLPVLKAARAEYEKLK
jgi:predicted Zn-dependent protease